MGRFLGIDTSCYTTSAAIYDSEEGLINEERIGLTVKPGKRGLSQSEMVFQHVRNLPVILKKMSPYFKHMEGIGVSSFPRRRADSYMPAFLVGKGIAETVSITSGIPLFEFSHQENHAMAAIMSAPQLWGNAFYMMHLSGGTQDILFADWNHEGISIKDLFHSVDITAGQFIDRIGVSLGLSFPAGKKMEELARCSCNEYQVPVSGLKDAFSFAGAETKVQRDIQSGKYAAEDIAHGVLQSIGDSLEKVIACNYFIAHTPFVAVGGVMSNLYLRKRMIEICKDCHLKPYFAESDFSSDNAAGNAFGAFMRYKNEGIYGS